jgi:hypothetical protein
MSEFPAATTTTTPVSTRSATAMFKGVENPPPRLAFRTYLAVGSALFNSAT